MEGQVLTRFPEIRVTFKGAHMYSVLWLPSRTDEAAIELTGMRVVGVESMSGPRDVPTVKVTFAARLVEVEAEDG